MSRDRIKNNTETTGIDLCIIAFLLIWFFSWGRGVVKYILLNLSNRTKASFENFHVFYSNQIIGHNVITFIYVN